VKYLLDTNVIIDAVGGCAPAIEAIRQAVGSEWVGYSAITRLECFGYSGLDTEEEQALMIVTGELEEVAVTSNIVDRAIHIRRAIRIKTPDAIIAATALELNASLITRNETDFESVEGLQVINPWDS
jgi:predicted nucleic acid-binding protein